MTFLDQNGPPEHLTRLFELSGGSEKNLIFGTGDLGSKMAKNWNLNMAHWITKFSCSLVWVTSRAQKNYPPTGATNFCTGAQISCPAGSGSWTGYRSGVFVRLHSQTIFKLDYSWAIHWGPKLSRRKELRGQISKKKIFSKNFFEIFFCFLIFDPNFGP